MHSVAAHSHNVRDLRCAAVRAISPCQRTTFPLGDLPIFFFYVNIGPHIAVQDMLTDVYLHLAYVWHSRSPTQAIVH